MREDAMLMIEITEDDPNPAVLSAHTDDVPACLASYGIPQALILAALQKLPTLKTLRLCKPSPDDEWEIQEVGKPLAPPLYQGCSEGDFLKAL
jgi:hypothetical protein